MSINSNILNNFEILTLKSNDIAWSLNGEQATIFNQDISNLVVNEIDFQFYNDEEELLEFLQDKKVCSIDDRYYILEEAVNGDSVNHDGTGNYVKTCKFPYIMLSKLKHV